MRRLRLSLRLGMLVGLVAIAVMAFAAISLQMIRDARFEDRVAKIRSVVEFAHGLALSTQDSIEARGGDR